MGTDITEQNKPTVVRNTNSWSKVSSTPPKHSEVETRESAAITDHSHRITSKNVSRECMKLEASPRCCSYLTEGRSGLLPLILSGLEPSGRHHSTSLMAPSSVNGGMEKGISRMWEENSIYWLRFYTSRFSGFPDPPVFICKKKKKKLKLWRPCLQRNK